MLHWSFSYFVQNTRYTCPKMQGHFISTFLSARCLFHEKKNYKLCSFKLIESLLLKVLLSFMMHNDSADPGVEHVLLFLNSSVVPDSLGWNLHMVTKVRRLHRWLCQFSFQFFTMTHKKKKHILLSNIGNTYISN